MWVIALGFLKGSFNFLTTKPGVYLLLAGLAAGGLWYVDHRAYNRGVAATETVWQGRVATAERLAAEKQAARDKITSAIEVAFWKKKADAAAVTITVTKEIPRYVTVEIDRAYSVPCGLVRVLDAAVLSVSASELPYPAGLADDTACPVATSVLAEAGVAAIRGYIEVTDQLTALQLWVETQEKMNSGPNSGEPVASQVQPIRQTLNPNSIDSELEQHLAQAEPVNEGFRPVGNDLPHTNNNALR